MQAFKPSSNVGCRILRTRDAKRAVFGAPLQPVGSPVRGSEPPSTSVRTHALPPYVIERKVRQAVDNRRAIFEYELLERFEAGIELEGTEVKSIVKGQCSLQDAFCRVIDKELYVLNMYVGKLGQANAYDQHLERRKRRLLVSKREVLKLMSRQQETGLTLVPTKLYFRGPWLKIEVAVARGKKLYDKREDIKRKEQDRNIERAVKNF